MLPLLVRTRFPGSFSLPRRGSFRLSLTVLVHYRSVRKYLALEDGPPYSDRIPRVPPYSSSSQHVHFCVRGCHPVSRAFQTLPLTHTDSGSGLLPVRSPLLGESRLISFPRGTSDVSVPPVRLINLWIQLMIVSKHTGFPHSEIAGYNGSYHLTDAYRRLARPSSPLTARASTVCA